MDTHTETLLGPDALHAEAAASTGLVDFGNDDTYREPMAVFLSSISGRREGTFVRTGGTRPRLAHTLDTPALRAARKGASRGP